MEYFKELDIFGSDIKWKMFKKDTFKSYFGGFVTIIIFFLLALKIYYFLEKYYDYGFAKNNMIYTNMLNSNETETINLTNFTFGCEFIVLNQKIQQHLFPDIGMQEINYTISDYINFKLFWVDSVKTKPVLKIEEVRASSFSDDDDFENLVLLKFAAFAGGNDQIKIPFKNTKNFNYQKLRFLELFKIEFAFTDAFVSLLPAIDDGQIIYQCYYDYFFLNNKEFKLEKFTNKIFKQIRFNYSSYQAINLRKIEVERKMDMDIKDIYQDQEDAFDVQADPVSYELVGGDLDRERDSKGVMKEKRFYLHQFQFFIDTFKLKNDVVLLSLDDILSVIGGFLELVTMLAEFIVVFYNDSIPDKLMRNHCLGKLKAFDEKLINIKNDLGKFRIFGFGEAIESLNKNKNRNNIRPCRDKDSAKNQIDFKIKKESELAFRFAPKHKAYEGAKVSKNTNDNILSSYANIEDEFANVSNKIQINRIQTKINIDSLSMDKTDSKLDTKDKRDESINIIKGTGSKSNEVLFSFRSKVEDSVDCRSGSGRELNAILEKHDQLGKNFNRIKGLNYTIRKQRNNYFKNKIENLMPKNGTWKQIMKKTFSGLNGINRNAIRINYNEFIDVECFLNLISGFDCLKLIMFDDINKNLFERISDLNFHSMNLKQISPNDPNSVLELTKDTDQSQTQREILNRIKENAFKL